MSGGGFSGGSGGAAPYAGMGSGSGSGGGGGGGSVGGGFDWTQLMNMGGGGGGGGGSSMGGMGSDIFNIGTSIGRMIVGRKQRKRGYELAASLERPEFSIENARQKNRLMQRMAAQETLPNIATARQDNAMALSQVLNATRGMGSSADILNSAARSAGKMQRSNQMLDREGKLMQKQATLDYAASTGELQKAKERKYEADLEKYKMDAAAASAMIEAGYENIFSGTQSAGSYFLG